MIHFRTLYPLLRLVHAQHVHSNLASVPACVMKDLYWMQRFKQLKEESGDLEDAYDGKVVQGTCQRLEKSYFRLTSAPDPAVVRTRVCSQVGPCPACRIPA